MKWVRTLYDWVLTWSDSKYGGVALFVIAFAEASFFPIPPDVLLIALCVGERTKAIKFALICLAGSVLGGAAGYAIGWGAWQAVDQFFFSGFVPGFTEEIYAKISNWYEEYDFWIVFVAAFTPFPYKVFTIAAGVFEISFPMFMLASLVGRAGRFFLVAGLLYFFGAPIRAFIDKWFNILVVLFTVILIGSFVLLKYLH